MKGIKVYIDEVEVKDVVLIDQNTLEIITHEGTIGPKDIRIENTDGGSFILEDGIMYILPIPEKPTGFEAYPGHERSIVLKWNSTPGAARYKIYGRKGTKGDYTFIGETTNLEYYLKDLQEDTRYYFKLWALNKYGESQGYDYTSATTLKAKYDQGDGKYDQEETKETVIKYSSGGVIIDLPTKYSSSQYSVDLTAAKYENYDTIQMNIPLAAIDKAEGSISLRTNDIMMYVPIHNLNTSLFHHKTTNKDDTNIIIKISKPSKVEKDRLTKSLTRKEEAITEAYNVEIILQSSRTTEPLKIYNGVTLGIFTEKEKIENNKLYMAKYNIKENKLEEYSTSVSSNYNSSKKAYIYYVYGQVTEDGKFILIYRK